MRSRQLETALTALVTEVASLLRAEVAAGAEVPFEIGSRSGRSPSTTPLYCYRALTGEFIAQRDEAIKRLPGHAKAAKLLEGLDGLDGYLAVAGSAGAPARAPAAITALLADVFDEQTDFELRPERLRGALARLERSELAGPATITLVATLHGLAIASPELGLTKGLTIAQPDALAGLPDTAAASWEAQPPEHHLLVVHTAEDGDSSDALATGCDVISDLLRALRLFGDGRIALGGLAWARLGDGAWTPLVLGAGGRPEGILVVTAEQEDELRAFCNLVSRRSPHGGELAWALRRFEMGCERENADEALTDHLLALRALLEPEGPASGLLAGRLAALCATAEHRAELAERITQTIALQDVAIAGTSLRNAGARALKRELGSHLRALLRDVICGHLSPHLAAIADELLQSSEEDQRPPDADPAADSDHARALAGA